MSAANRVTAITVYDAPGHVARRCGSGCLGIGPGHKHLRVIECDEATHLPDGRQPSRTARSPSSVHASTLYMHRSAAVSVVGMFSYRIRCCGAGTIAAATREPLRRVPRLRSSSSGTESSNSQRVWSHRAGHAATAVRPAGSVVAALAVTRVVSTPRSSRGSAGPSTDSRRHPPFRRASPHPDSLCPHRGQPPDAPPTVYDRRAPSGRIAPFAALWLPNP